MLFHELLDSFHPTLAPIMEILDIQIALAKQNGSKFNGFARDMSYAGLPLGLLLGLIQELLHQDQIIMELPLRVVESCRCQSCCSPWLVMQLNATLLIRLLGCACVRLEGKPIVHIMCFVHDADSAPLASIVLIRSTSRTWRWPHGTN